MSVYEDVTNQIVSELEKGVAPWVKPWRCTMPMNFVSGRGYRGINVMLLWGRQYRSPYWLTYKQAAQKGGHVKKGEKATRIVYTSSFIKKDEAEADGQEGKEIRFLRFYWVFNVEQTEGIPYEAEEKPTTEPIERTKAFLERVGANVSYGGQRAYYQPSTDSIRLPVPDDFEGAEHFYATSLHEHVHWTGHPSRLARDLSGHFGSQDYAAEELVAELGSAFLCAHLGIQGKLRHAEYLGFWIKVLKEDKRAIFKAASQATTR